MKAMYIILGNFGNHSLAAMQFLLEKQLHPIYFVSIETGWAAPSWSEHVTPRVNYAHHQGVQVHQLSSLQTFSEMVLDRKQFPSQKFQWCASFLKGITILNFLDEYDPSGEAIIVSGKRQADSRRYSDLKEYDLEHEIYQGRTLWHPLAKASDKEFLSLITRTGFQPLSHPSLECNPCIHMNTTQLKQVEDLSLKRLSTLENQVGCTMFPTKSLPSVGPKEPLFLSQFDLGCGSIWNCGE